MYDKVNYYLNDRIKEQSDSFEHCTLLPLDELPRHHYTTHGLHFGKKGKREIGRLLANLVYAITDKHNQMPVKRETDTISKSINGLETNTDLCPEYSFNEENIKILQGDMGDIIDFYQGDKSSAFAHCISADYYMNAGVAKTFRKHFGRPLSSDCMCESLTLQQSNSSRVYGLVTKSVYYGETYTG